MVTLLSKEDVRKADIKDFLLNCKVFKDEVAQLLEGVNSHIDNLTREKVSDSKVAELNLRIGERNMVQKILWLFDDFENEVKPKGPGGIA